MQWNSDDPEVAEVDPTGVVTANGPGQATITATYQGLAGSATVTVAVGPEERVLSSVDLTPAPPVLESGGTHAFTATATYSDDTSTPLSAGVQWNSSDADVAEVDRTGVVTANGPGRATITATYQGVQGTATVTVAVGPEERVLSSVDLTPAPPVLEPGGTHAFTATASYSDGTSTPLSSGVQWNSDNPDVADVDPAGVVTANGPGRATITATYQGVQGDATVTVNTPVE